jgi:putative transcriptional regulator
MSDALADKRTASRFRILAEIAERQPAVSQGEIADAVGVTSQAVSEYIRELTEDGLVEKEGRSRYRVTKQGVDWLFQEAKSLRRYVDHVTEDTLETLQEEAAIATEPIEAGEAVSLSLRDGLLHATPGEEGPATGVATTDAEPGTDVGVTGFEGVIEMDPGTVTVYRVPPVRNGGSRGVDDEELGRVAQEADLVLASGVEAAVALRRVEAPPTVTAAAGEVAADAAARGVDSLVAVTRDEVGRVTDALRDGEVEYVVEGA